MKKAQSSFSKKYLKGTTLLMLVVAQGLLMTGVGYVAALSLRTPITIGSNSSNRLTVRSCVVRWNKMTDGLSSPYLFIDDNHPCRGIDSITLTTAFDVQVTPNTGTFIPVVYAAATADETLAKNSVMAGLSVGADRAIMKMSRAGAPIKGNDPVLSSTGVNIWLIIITNS